MGGRPSRGRNRGPLPGGDGAPASLARMSFHAPAFLIALLLLPLAIALYVRTERRRARRADRIVARPLRPAVLPRRPGARRHVPIAFHALALAGLLLALARPHATTAVEAERATVVVLTDRSGSMQATDVAPTRLVAARAPRTRS
jgi:Ca-activated chloride channel family protein